VEGRERVCTCTNTSSIITAWQKSSQLILVRAGEPFLSLLMLLLLAVAPVSPCDDERNMEGEKRENKIVSDEEEDGQLTGSSPAASRSTSLRFAASPLSPSLSRSPPLVLWFSFSAACWRASAAQSTAKACSPLCAL
jgi:hypothetical protein